MGLFKPDNGTRTGLTGHRWMLPGLILGCAILLLFAGEAGREALRFDRAGIEGGNYWRLVSGHFVHIGWSHFALNAAGLALVWFLVGEAFEGGQWVLVIAASIAFIDLGIWLFNPQLQWYVGLSGLLHGILAAGLVATCRPPRTETVVLAALLLAKLAWEQLVGPVPGSEGSSGGSVIVDAHLYGTIGGILMAAVILIRVRRAASI
jgi:rhomboid family GlyGly-CTERM serine protease